MRPLAVYAALAALIVFSPRHAQILKIGSEDPKLYKSFKVRS
jgi:hypothetical protein